MAQSMQLRRDGTVLESTYVNGISHECVFIQMDNPGAGSHTYDFNQVSSGITRRRIIVLVIVKK